MDVGKVMRGDHQSLKLQEVDVHKVVRVGQQDGTSLRL